MNTIVTGGHAMATAADRPEPHGFPHSGQKTTGTSSWLRWGVRCSLACTDNPKPPGLQCPPASPALPLLPSAHGVELWGPPAEGQAIWGLKMGVGEWPLRVRDFRGGCSSCWKDSGELPGDCKRVCLYLCSRKLSLVLSCQAITQHWEPSRVLSLNLAVVFARQPSTTSTRWLS